MRSISLVAIGGLLATTTVAFATQVAVTVTDSSGKPLAEAVVALAPLGGPTLPTQHRQASLDQLNKTFRPHVLAIQVGTSVTFPNSDQIRHQVYSFSDAKKFETKLYSGQMAAPVTFDKAGVVTLGCNIHDSMRAYIYVLDTPYFATTDAAGHGTVSVPAGRYAVNIWHPRHASGRTPATDEMQVDAADQTLSRTLDVAINED